MADEQGARRGDAEKAPRPSSPLALHVRPAAGAQWPPRPQEPVDAETRRIVGEPAAPVPAPTRAG